MNPIDEAVSRQTAWQRDYGDKCSPQFNADLKTLLDAAREMRKWEQLRPEECPDCGCRSITLTDDAVAWNCDGCKHRWYAKTDDLERQKSVQQDTISALRYQLNEIERTVGCYGTPVDSLSVIVELLADRDHLRVQYQNARERLAAHD